MDPVLDRFVYRKATPGLAGRIETLCGSARNLADWLASQPMEPRCRALAITKLEEVLMWANKGFAFATGPEAGTTEESA